MLARQFADAGQLRHFEHARITHVARTQGQVVAQAAGQQRQVVGDVADLLAQVGDIQLPQVQAIEQDLAFFRGIEAHDQPRQRAFARTAAADDADAFARLDAQGDVVQGWCVLPCIAKGDMADLQRPLQLSALQGALAGLAFLRQGHQCIGAAHGQLCLLVTGDQAGDLPQWSEHAAAQHVGSDQGADAEVAGDNAVHTGDNGSHATELLDEQGAIGCQRRQVARVAVEPGQGTMGGFPLVLALAFSAASLEGFQAAQGFDQQRLAHGTQAQAFFHGVAQPRLDEHGKEDGDGKGDDRNHHQPAPEQANDHEHQHGKGQVDDAGQGDGGQELA
ncbi:hypothetical protein D9M71_254900 [compost metagenome]